MDCLGYNISSARSSQLGRANPPQLIQNWEKSRQFQSASLSVQKVACAADTDGLSQNALCQLIREAQPQHLTFAELFPRK